MPLPPSLQQAHRHGPRHFSPLGILPSEKHPQLPQLMLVRDPKLRPVKEQDRQELVVVVRKKAAVNGKSALHVATLLDDDYCTTDAQTIAQEQGAKNVNYAIVLDSIKIG